MSESGLLLNITSDAAKPVLRKSRKRVRIVNSGRDSEDADNVSTRSKIPASYDLKQKVDNGIGLQSFITKR